MKARATVAIALAGALGCTAPASADREARAREAVRRFFALLPSGDCASLEPLLALAPGHRCREVVDELNRHRLRLDEVLAAEVDGRDPNAVIVRARVEQGGERRVTPMLLRVEKRSGKWRLRF